MTSEQFESLSRALRLELQVISPGATLTGMAVLNRGAKGWKMLICGIDHNGNNLQFETSLGIPVGAPYSRVVAYIVSNVRTLANNPKIEKFEM